MKKITQLLLMCFTIVVFGQTEKKVDWTEMGDAKSATFYEVQAAFNAYWKDKTPARGQGYKPFKRWEDYMESRVYPSGNMNLTSLTYTNYIEWLKNNFVSEYISTTQRSAANWIELGPIGSPSGPSPYTRTGAGRLNFVRFDPTNSNTMYVHQMVVYGNQLMEEATGQQIQIFCLLLAAQIYQLIQQIQI